VSTEYVIAGVWDIIVDSGYHIILMFNGRFDIENSEDCGDDYVTLTDPAVSAALGKFCGHETPGNVTTTSNRLRVRFRSDLTTTAKGFNASWTIGCGGRLTEPEGTIVSPGFPNPPENNLECRWEIVADSTAPNIRLDFDAAHFDIEGSRRLMLKEANSRSSIGYHMQMLCHDYLIVYGEKSDNESDAISKPARICGSGSSEIPQSIVAQNKMTVLFYTDFALAGNGFKLTYKTQRSKLAIRKLLFP
jgi:cubilin